MVIKNAMVLSENFVYEKLDVEFGEKIIRISQNIECEEYIDGEGQKLIPGLIDIHSHGANGVDACTDNVEDYVKLTQYYAKNAITSMLFTYATYPLERIITFFKTANEYLSNRSDIYTYAHGFHLEGVFINPEKKGAQSEENILSPSKQTFQKLFDAADGNLKLLILAPEMENALEFLSYVKNYACVSLGHTNADYQTACEAFDSGAKSITHAFNGMSGVHHRNPGVIGAALDKSSYIEMICDGVHIHPAVERMMFKCCDEDKLIFVSDSMAATGMSDGEYILSGQKVIVKDNKATLPDGTIAGSTTNLFECMKKSILAGCKEENAIRAASLNPATMIGVNDVTGSIAVGKNADLVLTDSDLNIKEVFIKGKKI